MHVSGCLYCAHCPCTHMQESHGDAWCSKWACTAVGRGAALVITSNPIRGSSLGKQLRSESSANATSCASRVAAAHEAASAVASPSSRSASSVACSTTDTCGNMLDGRCMPSNATQYGAAVVTAPPPPPSPL